MAKRIWNNPINKHTDWNGDESTENLPVSGEMVQKFLREGLEGKIGVLYYDPTANRYLAFADAENRDLYLEDPEEHRDLVMGTFDAPFNYTATITLVDTQPVNYLDESAKGVYIKAQFDTKNKEGQSVGESVTVTIKIKAGTKQVTLIRQCAYGALFTLSMDDYLSSGTNTVSIGIQGNDTYAATTTTLTYYVMSLSLVDQFDLGDISHDGSELDTLPVDYTIKGTGIKHLEWYVDGVRVPYEPLDDISVSELSRTKYISLYGLAPGRHNLQYRAYVDTSDGQRFYSDTLYRDFVIVGGSEKVILASFRSPALNGIIDAFAEAIPLYGMEQYKTKEISYAMYDPYAAADNVLAMAFDGKTTNYNVLNGYSYIRELKPYNAGNLQLVLSCGGVTVAFNAPVTASSLNLSPITDTEFEFDGSSRNNSSADRSSYVSKGHSIAFTGFKWNEGSGWTGEGLLIDSGARIDIDFAPLAGNVTVRGITIEIEFESRRVLDDNAVICNLRSGNTGLLLTASEASLTSLGGVNVSTKYKSGENTRVTFIVNRTTGVTNKGLVFICVNGVLSGAVPYVAGDSFITDTMMSFVGSSDANILLRQILIYNRALSLHEVENNYNLYRPTVEELLQVYDHNDIYEPNSENLSLEKLSGQTPIIIVTGDMEALQNATDKNTEVRMDKLEVINMDDPTRNMVLTDLIMRPQGTSSMSYPKKNFRFYSKRGNDTKMYDYQGKEVADRLYSFKDKAQRVKTWCLKADYAESSSTHNTGVARLWNDVMKNMRIENTDARYKAWRGDTIFPGETQAQEIARLSNYPYDVRTTVDGFPIVLFYHLHEEDPLIFLGKYNWNNDKSTESVYGFEGIEGFDNTNMECWEMLDSGLDISMFKSVAEWDTMTVDSKGNPIKMWQRSFEGRYPDGSVDDTHLKAFATWVASTNGAAHVVDGHLVVDDQTLMSKFSDEKWQHMDVYKMAAYYIYLMRFGGVDQVAKNAMLTSEDGVHYYFINYDNDTIFGVRNDGLLKFGYDIDRQSKDPSDPNSYCYAGHDSVLWNNLEADAEFMDIVKKVDDALYKAGLTYKNTIDMFNNKQSAKWSEKLHNLDYQFKYLDVWNDAGNNQLEKLQGPRSSHRKWWIAHRFAKFDAMNFVGGYTGNYIEIKTDSSNVEQQTVKITPSSTGQIYGYGIKARAAFETGVVGTKDVVITFITPEGFYFQIGNPLDFYNAAYIKKFDASLMASHIQEMFFDSINSAAEDSTLEEVVLGNENIQNVICTQLGSISYVRFLKRLDIRNFRALASLDLSQNLYLEELDARNCAALTGIVLPVAAPIERLYLPDALQTLAMRNLASLQTLSIEGYGANINTFNILGCPTCPICTSFEFLRQWKAHRTSNAPVNVVLDNINWTFTDQTELLAFVRYIQDCGGSYTLRGRATLTDIDLEGINEIFEVFGENAFRPNADFRIIADGLFLVGPAEVLSGGQYQYQLINASGETGNTSYSVIQAASTGATINNQGLLTIPEVLGSDKTITIRGSFTDAQTGTITDKFLNISVKKLVYPADATIIGDNRIEQRSTYVWETTTEGINTLGKMIAEWSLSGDITDYVRIYSQNIESCILELFATPLVASGTLTLTLRKALDNSLVATTTKTISVFNNLIAFTKETDPHLIAVMHENRNANGDLLCASADYMTKEECHNVVSGDLYKNLTPTAYNSIFYSNANFRNNCTNIDALKWFTGLTEIPDYCFSGCQLTDGIIPQNVTKIGENAYFPSLNRIGNNRIQLYNGSIRLAKNAVIENVEVVRKTSETSYQPSAIVVKTANLSFTIRDVTINTFTILIGNSLQAPARLDIDFAQITGTGFVFDSYTRNLVTEIYATSSNGVIATPIVTTRGGYNSGHKSVIYFDNTITTLQAQPAVIDIEMDLLALDHVITTNIAISNNIGKIIVRHVLLNSYKTASGWSNNPNITDGFVEESLDDFTVTGDDVIGQATGTLLSIVPLYSGHYADGTPGQEASRTILREQESNFFPQNDTNAAIQRTFNVTYEGITKSCTITQNPKRLENNIRIVAATHVDSEKVLCRRSGSGSRINKYTIIDVYLNNRRVLYTATNPTYNTYGILKVHKEININDELLICVEPVNNVFDFDFSFNGNQYNLNNDYIKEFDISSFNCSTNVQNMVMYQTHMTKMILCSQITGNNYSNVAYQSALTELVCLSPNSPTSDNPFAGISTIGALKYPAGADYGNMIANLPAGWTHQDYDVLGSYANDYQITADDCEASATSTTVHIRKKYNVTELDGTAGYRWIETTQQSSTFAANTSSNPITHTGTYSDADIVSATYTFTQAGVVPDYVDLGLPSGLKWRKMNIGATNPQDAGDYFSWGNTDGHAVGSGYYFDQDNYSWTPGASISADLTSSNDAASVNLGSSWRMPTQTEFQELYDNTDSEWVANFEGTGVAGRKFMKKTDHSVFVFFPACGYWYRNSRERYGVKGFYMNSTFNTAENRKDFIFDAESINTASTNGRALGSVIRAVK